MNTILPRAFAVWMVAWWCVACGGEDLGDRGKKRTPSDAEPLDRCAADDGFEFAPLLDFEPAGTRPRCTFDGCSQDEPYFSLDDRNTPGRAVDNPYCPPGVAVEAQPPTGGAQNMRSTALPEPRCGDPSTAAMHFVLRNAATCTHPFTGRLGWGGSFQQSFVGSADLSEWDGVSFWIRRGERPELGDNQTSNKSINVLVVDDGSIGSGSVVCETAECIWSAELDGTLTPSPECAIPDTAKCDPFIATVPLEDEWTFVPLRFADLRQKGYGVVSPRGRVDTTQVFRFQFLITAGDWNFWLDDIALFRAPE